MYFFNYRSKNYDYILILFTNSKAISGKLYENLHSFLGLTNQ